MALFEIALKTLSAPCKKALLLKLIFYRICLLCPCLIFNPDINNIEYRSPLSLKPKHDKWASGLLLQAWSKPARVP
jgi:hypothetical protein